MSFPSGSGADVQQSRSPAWPSMDQLGQVASHDARKRARGCDRPVRLVGETVRRRVNKSTGEVVGSIRYGSSQEIDGITYVRCGDRRAQRCESCSREYKGDAWHLLISGLTGGKGVTDEVSSHPTTFATLTPPSFGPVHGLRRGAPCRARRDRPLCPHGRPLYCMHRHRPDDRRLGEPLCPDCYDYEGHVLWQWKAPELWRRFRIALDRELASTLGVTERRLKELARIDYSKVAEFQARGLIHVHALVRLDGPDGPDTAPPAGLNAVALGEIVTAAARHVRYTFAAPGCRPLELRWGDQIDTRPIALDAGRDDQSGPAHPAQLAAYLAKYLTKATEDFGLDSHGKVHSADDARVLGASPHALAIIETAQRIAAEADPDDDLATLAKWFGTLGYRGHVLTKSRRYSTTFKALRQARSDHRQGFDREPPAEPARQLDGHDHDDADIEVIEERHWTFVGVGFLDADQAALAMVAAMQALNRRRPR